jgi:hypothetical protein
MDRLTKEQLEWMNGYVPANIHDIYADGGIHIKPSHEGRFTAYKKRTGKTTEEALHSPDPHVRQMANFARNAAKWKHQDGGAAGGDDQVMQIIQAYAESQGVDPNELISEIQKMTPDQQKKALSKMYETVTGKQMQEGGPAPQEMMAPEGQPQGGQEDSQQIIEAVKQMLQQGAAPEEVIAQLLQEQIDPQMIVQIFVQLGMPEQEVMQEIQAVMQQGQPQEQENPEEQMQEQGMEEPEGQPMAYGGTPHFDFGGYNEYRAPGILNHSKFNSTMLGINSLADPTVSAIPYMSMMNNPFSAALGIGAGVAGLAAGEYAAYGALGHKKNDPQYGQFFNNANNNASKIPGSIKLSTPSSTGEMWDKYNAGQRNDLWSKHNPKQDPFKVSNYGNWKPGMQEGGEYEIGEDVYTTTPSVNPVTIPTSGSYSANYQNDPNVMQPMKVAPVYTNGRFDRNTTADLQKEYNIRKNVYPEYINLKNMYKWMEENNASEDAWHNYVKKTNKANNKYQGVGKYNENKNEHEVKCGKDNGSCVDYGDEMMAYGGELPHAQVGISDGFDFNDPYGLQQERFGQTANYADTQGYGYNNSQNSTYENHADQSISLTDAQVANENNGYAFPKYAPKNNKNINNINKKVLNTYNMSGPGIATNMLNSLGMINTGAGYFQQEKQRKAAYERNKFNFGPGRMLTDVYNNPNPNGEYTVNSGKLKAANYTPIQDVSTSQYAKYGGSTQYAQGGEYHVTHDELLQLMRNGAEVEFL